MGAFILSKTEKKSMAKMSVFSKVIYRFIEIAINMPTM